MASIRIKKQVEAVDSEGVVSRSRGAGKPVPVRPMTMAQHRRKARIDLTRAHMRERGLA